MRLTGPHGHGQCAINHFQCMPEIAFLAVNFCQFNISRTLEGVTPDRFPEFILRLLQFALFLQHNTEVVVRLGIFRTHVIAGRACCRAAQMFFGLFKLGFPCPPDTQHGIHTQVIRIALERLFIVRQRIYDSIMKLLQPQTDQVQLLHRLVLGRSLRILHQL
ncbi:MAG: hypothetical protein C4582_01755, partial [Desulfobacteraceae bacterium]